ncbi:MAG: NAD(P)/FAD-dependent oxidoreductase [Clostridia bacterium]|nr:MAG: NAD(P)/FAD-dependent oxidoreductase [Clostridia bacterium]
MAKVVVIGAGFAGQTAALYLGDALGRDHDITVINKYDVFGYTPSWVWVGVGQMAQEKTIFKLKPVYDKFHINFVQGTATAIYTDDQYVLVDRAHGGGEEKVPYDYLMIATGAKLNFAGTPGLGPHDGYTTSICSVPHAVDAWEKLQVAIARMEKGERQKIVVGTGHPGATCQGAAFEYISNIHKILESRGVRDKAELLWLSNEPALGDFGVRGLRIRHKGKLISSDDFIRAAFELNDTQWQVQTGVRSVEEGKIYWENYEGEEGETDFDFAMLIPQFLGPGFTYYDKDGQDITSTMANKGGFVLVDAVYGLDWDTLAKRPDAWPAVYQNRTYNNIFAAGIAFAPPGSISRPHVNPNGLSITAAPPRTGMISGIIGRLVAKNIIDLVKRGRMTHAERMTEMFAACIASMGDSLWDGSAATIVIYPVVPDPRTYPNEEGRDLFVTDMEMGLAGAWMKRMIHSTFMHKLQGRIGWKMIPE